MTSLSNNKFCIGTLENHEDFSKRILVHGTGDATPKRGSVCVIQMRNLNKVDLSEVNLGGYEFEGEVEVTIGEKNQLLPNLFDKVLMSMKKGEQAYVKSKIDIYGNRVFGDMLTRYNLFEPLLFNISLLSFSTNIA